jgi:hypothetical protein
MLFVFLSLVGGFLNRVRGSGIGYGNKWYFAIFFGLAHGYMTHNAWLFPLAFACMRIAYAPGWDVSEFYGNPPKVKNNFLDPIDRNRFKDRPLIHCTYRMTLRGLFFGGMVAIGSLTAWPLLAGLLMGIVYFFGCYVIENRLKYSKDGLAVSEVIWGVIIMASSLIKYI